MDIVNELQYSVMYCIVSLLAALEMYRINTSTNIYEEQEHKYGP